MSRRLVATGIAISGLTIVLYFNPLWIGFEQERTGVPGITGYTPEQVRTVTGSILADLFFGPPGFAVAVNGQPVLDSAERSHMVDVRSVLVPITILFGVALAVLVALAAANRRSAWVWRAIARRSSALALVGIAMSVAVLFFLDAAFLLFHLVFFPQGNFSFDPRSQRLTQLFPDQFWTETSSAIAIVGLAIAVAVASSRDDRPFACQVDGTPSAFPRSDQAASRASAGGIIAPQTETVPIRATMPTTGTRKSARSQHSEDEQARAPFRTTS